MFRFTIRDWLWTTALIAMGLAWWADRQSYEASRRLMYSQLQEMRGQTKALREALTNARMWHDVYYRGKKPPYTNRYLPWVNWGLPMIPNRRNSASAQLAPGQRRGST